MLVREAKSSQSLVVSPPARIMDHYCNGSQSSGSSSGVEDEAVFTFFRIAAHLEMRIALSRYSGLLLSSHEKNATFPAVHIADANYNRPQVFKPLDEHQHFQQGIYREIRRIDPDYEVKPYKNSITYILLGFNGIASNMNKVMIDTWKDWSGARHIYMNLPDELGLARITLFQRETPNELSQFMYIVLVECRNVITQEQQSLLLDFCQRLRVERITGYISVYSCAMPSERESLHHNR